MTASEAARFLGKIARRISFFAVSGGVLLVAGCATGSSRHDVGSAAAKWYVAGEGKMALADYDGAVADFDRAIALAPEFLNAYNARGLAKDKKNDHEGAIADYSRAIALNPGFADAFCNRGFARMALKNFTGTIADETEAIRVKPDLAKAYELRGDAEIATGDAVHAIADLDKAKQWRLFFPLGSVAVSCVRTTLNKSP